MTRQKLTQAVNLSICLDRGFYLGAVAREKEHDLEDLKSYMSAQEYREYNERRAA